MLRRGNSAKNAPAFRDARASQAAFPRWSVRNDKYFWIITSYCSIIAKFTLLNKFSNNYHFILNDN